MVVSMQGKCTRFILYTFERVCCGKCVRGRIYVALLFEYYKKSGGFS